MEPHFFHLNSSTGSSCGGGEGPRHKKAKLFIFEAFLEDERFSSVKLEYRVNRFYVDIFLQTKYGPFYFEVIDTHEPEEKNIKELEGRIIPFWIGSFSDEEIEERPFVVMKEVWETIRYHFDLIFKTVSNLYELSVESNIGYSPKNIWINHGINGIFRIVQNVHMECKGNLPLLWSKSNFTALSLTEEDVILGYKLAKRELRNKREFVKKF